MNTKGQPDTATATTRTRRGARRERGYALVALLAIMTLLVIATMAAAPSIRQQSRRVLEREAIARGEEVAEAIRRYIHAKGTLPNTMDELVEGVAPFPGAIKKTQILRASAARDPLTASGEWRLVKQTDREFIDFIRSVTLYAGGRLPASGDDRLKQIEATFPRLTAVVDTGAAEEAPGGEETSGGSSGPFVGVASRSRRASILTYYDIERHDKWVFTPFFK